MMSTNTKARILVVDDSKMTRDMLAHILRNYGYAVDTVEDGLQAINYFMDHHPELILMDADMPVLDGVSACAKIRQMPDAKYLPIIMFTALAEREWVDRAYDAGATDYVTKPVNWDVLRNRIHYILQAKHAEEALFDEKEKAQVTLAAIGDGVISTDKYGQVEYLNPAATRFTGWIIEDAIGKPLREVFNIADEHDIDTPIEFPINHCIEEGRPVSSSGNIVIYHDNGHKEIRPITLSGNAILKHKDGKQSYAIEDSAAPIRDRNGYIIGAVLVFHDVTENRKLTRELAYQAKHDDLTSLYNVHEFNVQMQRVYRETEECLSLGLENGRRIEHALLYMDLDQFKIVNDTCGHEAGDQLLKNIALLMNQQVKNGKGFQYATLARLGGDEFGLLLEYCTMENALKIAHSIREEIDTFRFTWQNDKKENMIFSVGISLGLVMINKESISINQKGLTAMADAACYAAKNKGRNSVHVYKADDQELNARREEIQWLTIISENLEKDKGFVLYYQPVIEVATLKPTYHYEILLRMDNQKGELLLPGAFLSAAARYNLMPDLDKWVFNHTVEWLHQHPQFLDKIQLLSLNVSGYSLNDKGFLENIIDKIQNCKIPANKLCFEINETSVTTNLTGAVHFVEKLRTLGCKFALDDFGSGLSSFIYLRTLPMDFLKINGDFVRNLMRNNVDLAMVKAINEIGHLMQIKTIAESVESIDIIEHLKNLSVDFAQGYWLNTPRPLNQFSLV